MTKQEAWNRIRAEAPETAALMRALKAEGIEIKAVGIDGEWTDGRAPENYVWLDMGESLAARARLRAAGYMTGNETAPEKRRR